MFVYIIKSDDLYKIGKVKKPEERLKALQTGNPTQLELQYTKRSQRPLELESKLHNHKLLKEYRVRGEWFKIPDNVLKYIVIEYGFDCHITEQPKIVKQILEIKTTESLLNNIQVPVINNELFEKAINTGCNLFKVHTFPKFEDVFGNPFK